MGYCYDQGIPYSEYLERWSSEDRSRVTAHALEKAGRCPSCGTNADEWDEDMDAYTAMYVTCTGCMRREIMQAGDAPISKGTSVRLVPKAMAAKQLADAERKRAEGSMRPRRRRE